MKRLKKLEQTQSTVVRKWHSLIGDTEAELDAKTQALQASPAWQEGDGIIRRLIVDPPCREHTLLKAYVQHVARAAMTADQVNRFRPEWIKMDDGLARLNRLMAMAERETKAMASMARVLRLAPSAQYGPRKGATINANSSDGPRPWD